MYHVQVRSCKKPLPGDISLTIHRIRHIKCDEEKPCCRRSVGAPLIEPTIEFVKPFYIMSQQCASIFHYADLIPYADAPAPEGNVTVTPYKRKMREILAH